MYPEINIGPLTLQTFGLMFGLAFVASGALLSKRLGEIGKPPDWAYEAVLAAGVGGLIGARLDYLIQNYDTVSGDLLGATFGGAGLVWLGGVIGGAIGVTLWARWRGFLSLRMVDVMAAPLALGYAVGRCGCQLSGDGDYGEAWNGPWAMAYPEGTVSIDTPVHPTPIYESLTMGLVALLLWRLRDRFAPGRLFALYLFLAGLERFLVEFVRRNDGIALGLTQAQLISVLMIVGGAIWFGLTASRGGPEPRPA